MATRVRPLYGRLVVQRNEAKERTKGGIFVPTAAREKPREGRVLAVGEGKRVENGELVPLRVKVDDQVVFSAYAGTEIKIGDEEYVILEESDVLCVLDEGG